MTMQDTVASASSKQPLRPSNCHLKLSKISTKPVEILVANLGREKSDRADLGIQSLCLKYGQSCNLVIYCDFFLD